MDRKTYALIENYMHACMGDTAHDREHVRRVLYQALAIAKTEMPVNLDVLIAACLLHDIGRREQFENPAVCHAMVGGEKAYQFLVQQGFSEDYARQVRHCVETHRYRKRSPPQSMEAKILFDADKLDVAGAVGIARTLLYKGIVGEPLYSLRTDGTVSDGDGDEASSFFQEYKYKLENLYGKFYTKRAAEIALERRQAAVDFYNSLYREVSALYQSGKDELDKAVQ